MTNDNKVPKQDQDQSTYQNSVEARRVIAVDESGNFNRDNDKLHDYKISDIEELSTITYIGYLRKDGSWYILRIENETDFRYVKGDSGYDFSNRGAESYNLFSDVF